MLEHPWVVQSLRYTAFVTDAPSPDNQWWLKTVGQLPAIRNSVPTTGFMHEEGSIDQGTLVIESQPFRLDCLLTVPQQSAPAAAVFPNLGEVEPVLHSFSEITKRFISIDSLPPINRIAFGATIFLAVGSHEEGHILVAKFLSLSNRLEGASDFLYQINRRREVELGKSKLTINRLSKWSVSMLSGIFLQIGAEVRATSQVPQNYAVRLELDVNTVPMTDTTYSRDESVGVFEILKQNAVEIAERGDIR